jgi:type IV pilus assembly protein PilP
MTRTLITICFVAGLLPVTAAGAQSPAPQTPAPQAPAPQTAAPPSAGAPAAPQTPAEAQTSAAPYTYDPAGRRDPFVSLLGKGGDGRTGGTRPSGVPGFLINEVSIKGIVKDRTGYLAMIQGSDNKTYVVRPGDRLLDGSVKSIVADAVVFSQDVNDPLSLIKQREIRKPLRSNQEGR